MDNGSTLHGGRFGFWLISPVFNHCTNVHNGAAQSLIRKRLIKKSVDDQWVKSRTPNELRREILDRMNHFYRQVDGSMKFPNSCEGDLLKMAHKFLESTP
jgi:hypothetical protein